MSNNHKLARLFTWGITLTCFMEITIVQNIDEKIKHTHV